MSRQSEAQQEEQLLFFERAMKREEGEIGELVFADSI